MHKINIPSLLSTIYKYEITLITQKHGHSLIQSLGYHKEEKRNKWKRECRIWNEGEIENTKTKLVDQNDLIIS